MKIKKGDKIKLTCYRGEKEFVYYTVVDNPFISEPSGTVMVKTIAPGVPGPFNIPVKSILEVIRGL